MIRSSITNAAKQRSQRQQVASKAIHFEDTIREGAIKAALAQCAQLRIENDGTTPRGSIRDAVKNLNEHGYNITYKAFSHRYALKLKADSAQYVR